jgi:hypothetical protein
MGHRDHNKIVEDSKGAKAATSFQIDTDIHKRLPQEYAHIHINHNKTRSET